MEGKDPGSPFASGSVRRVARRIDDVFSSLEKLPFLRRQDRTEFRYFKRLFLGSCAEIDARVSRGELKPWSKSAAEAIVAAAAESYPRGKAGASPEGHPRCPMLPIGPLRVGIFIGSFDPFQMTHLETALRFLSHGERPADIVFVVPEGSHSKLKPGRSDYGYRFDILSRQASEAFRPFIVPLDIGDGQDTIGIVKRLLRLFSGRSVSLTHVLGSDVFPMAARWYPEDLAAWTPVARKFRTEFDFGTFVVKRDKGDVIGPAARETRKLGIPVQIDRKPIGTPSSTELRERGVFTIVFPTPAVLEKMEVVFRYRMHRHWLTVRDGPDYSI